MICPICKKEQSRSRIANHLIKKHGWNWKQYSDFILYQYYQTYNFSKEGTEK